MTLKPIEEQLNTALWLLMKRSIHFYLRSNAHQMWDGYTKATEHRNLCKIIIGVCLSLRVEEDVYDIDGLFDEVHSETQALTNNLDTEIGFPLYSAPDYEDLVPKFFDKFVKLAVDAIIKFKVVKNEL